MLVLYGVYLTAPDVTSLGVWLMLPLALDFLVVRDVCMQLVVFQTISSPWRSDKMPSSFGKFFLFSLYLKGGIVILLNLTRYSLHLRHMLAVTHARFQILLINTLFNGLQTRMPLLHQLGFMLCLNNCGCFLSTSLIAMALVMKRVASYSQRKTSIDVLPSKDQALFVYCTLVSKLKHC